MPISRTRQKAEIELNEHVRKAVSPAETAPKQKHVRSCIVFTWDFQTSVTFWSALRMQPVLSDQVVCYKALITIHKLLVGGPHIVLAEALLERPFFENCLRVHGGLTLGYGYGPLISAYVEFLLEKLAFHQTHPEFTGSFDYEEFLSLKGVDNLDEGYQTISELMDLQDRVDRFQKTVFVNVRPMAQSECRIASLVPLVEESYGIYKFITSMLTAMHLCVSNADPLVPLVERYRGQFWALKKFYDECSMVRYLTTLIAIPRLPDEPPSFEIDDGSGRAGSGTNKQFPIVKAASPKEAQKKASKASPPPPTTGDLLGDFGEDQEESVAAAGRSLQERIATQHTHTITQIPVADAMMEQALRQTQLQVAVLTDQLQQAYLRHQEDRSIIYQYDQQLSELRQQFNAAAIAAGDQQRHSSEAASVLASHEAAEQARMWREKYEAAAAEAQRWKNKYEGMAALYQQLRKEHLNALEQIKALAAQLQQYESNLEAEKSATETISSQLGDRLAAELGKVIQSIEAAAAKLEAMRSNPALDRLSSLNAAVHAAIFDGTATITTAIGNLIRYAIQTQAEIVAAGKGSGTPDAFYRKHSEWTNGLVSAAQAVAAATTLLVETADAVLRGSQSMQHLVAASNSVAAATTQLVTASRVKASLNSTGQPLLESAAKAVIDANRRLVDSASGALSPLTEDSDPQYAPTGAFDSKIEELEKQARILALEKELGQARSSLATLRKARYNQADSGAEEANGNEQSAGVREFEVQFSAKDEKSSSSRQDQSDRLLSL